MREWIFDGDGKSGDPEYPYVNIFSNTSTPKDVENMTNVVYAEVRRGAPVPGQNNTTPPMFFANHQFAYVGGVYRDPSYGTE